MRIPRWQARQSKKTARALIERLPEGATWDDVESEIYVRRVIEAGIAESDAGDVVPLAEVSAVVRSARMTVNWTRGARGHLRAIHDYIALDSPHHARRFVDRLTRRSKILETMPLIGAEVPESGDPTVRELLVRAYRIIYRVLPTRIDVVAVIHGARLLPEELPGN